MCREGDNFMTTNVKKLLEEASKNSELSKKISILNETITDKEENKSALIDLAKEYDITLTADDFDETIRDIPAEELDIEELESVAGGKMKTEYDYHRGRNVLDSDCECPLAGTGSSDAYQNTCVCVVAGAGTLTDLGRHMAAEGALDFHGTKDDPVAMWCVMGGKSW